MKEGYWVIRTYEAGAIGEKTKFFVPGDRPTGKLRRKDRDAVRKQEQNAYSAVKTMARLLNENFVSGDLLMGLDYSDEGLQRIKDWGRKHGLQVDSEDEKEAIDALWESASHALDTALRRVKRRLGSGVELKAVYITSDMDGQTGEIVRVHHHLVVNAGVQEAFVSAWEKYGMGGVSWSQLYEINEDRTAIAEYFIRQVRRIPDAKKYRSTRNLKRPQPKDRVALSDAEVRVPAGAMLLYRQEFKPGQAQYIRYRIPQKQRKGSKGNPDIPQ